MNHPIHDLIIEMRTPERTEKEALIHKELHTRIAMAFFQGRITDTLLNECQDPECLDCGAIICPHHEPLHFHHDGCPACDGLKEIK